MPLRPLSLYSILPLAAVLTFGVAPAAVRAEGPVPAGAGKGSLVIAGGALRADNAQVWKKIVELAGAPTDVSSPGVVRIGVHRSGVRPVECLDGFDILLSADLDAPA